MHHALEIEEILLHIFACCRPNSKWRAALARLARTCRAFKEPALDVLWQKLRNLSPLARCLPEASVVDRYSSLPIQKCYFFCRPLASSEWDLLRSYTSRVRSITIRNGADKLNLESLARTSNPSATKPLFPNVRNLCIDYADEFKPLLLLPFPSLISLSLQFFNTHSFEKPLKSLARATPNLKKLSLMGISMNLDHVDLSFICCWENLEFVDCYNIPLAANTLVHLARTPALTRLNFKIESMSIGEISPSDSPLIFSTLDTLIMRSEFTHSMSRLISQTRLPTVTKILASIGYSPSQHDLSTFFTNIHMSGSTHSLRDFSLYQETDRIYPSDWPVFGFQDLKPCMAFGHLHQIYLNVQWRVDLADSELLVLASAWPHLEHFSINGEWGWHTRSGITPNGLLRLLQVCPSLTQIALAVDTRGYVDVPPSPQPLGSVRPPCLSYVNVIDSCIEAESVPAIATFFAGLSTYSTFSLLAWEGEVAFGRVREVRGEDEQNFKQRWRDVRRRVKQAVRQRCRSQP